MTASSADAAPRAATSGLLPTRPVKRSFTLSGHRTSISLEAAEAEVVTDFMPGGKALTPEQIAEVVAFLCSDAACEIRGASWSVDGGWTAH